MEEQQQKQKDLEACDKALHELLSAIIEHDERRRVARSTKAIEAISFDEMANIDFGRAEFDDLIEDPIRDSLRSGVRRIGKAMYKLTGSVDAMCDRMERVAALDPTWEDRRSSIADHAWNGIGEGEDRWWA